jgi:hypothetical protein
LIWPDWDTLCVKDRDDPLTEMIAKTIIKIAQTGVHNAAQLSALAIMELENRCRRCLQRSPPALEPKHFAARRVGPEATGLRNARGML